MTDSSSKLRSQKQRVLISGGSGLVGTRLSQLLLDNNFEVAHLSRNPTKKGYETFHWDIRKKVIDPQAITNTDVIVHLAGAGVADKRWTEEWKKEIYDSRIDSTQLLLGAVKEHNPKLKQFISASAIGYYGWDTGDRWMNEDDDKGEGFLSDVVADWEEEVSKFNALGIKSAMIRVGIVLSKNGGALQEMLKPINMGAGAALGSGKQFMSWIHIDDLCQMFITAIQKNLEGSYNAVGPAPVTNKELMKSIAKAANRPFFLPNLPSFVLKMMVGEMQVMLTGGNRVSCKKIEDSGFKFKFPSLDSTLKDLIS